MQMNRVVLKLGLMCVVAGCLGACSMSHNLLDSVCLKRDSVEFKRIMDQGRELVNERYHGKALDLFGQAGLLDPQNPEWLFEKARALFHMDRLDESLFLCRQALALDPWYYDALTLSWAARIEIENGSNQIKETIRREIEKLLDQRKKETGALQAAYEGYGFLKDRKQEQNIIVELARTSAAVDPDISDMIAGQLFEQILQEREDVNARIRLMEAYIFNFPQRRQCEYVVFQLMEKKREAETDAFDPVMVMSDTLKKAPKSKRLNIGIASWLIEENILSDTAVSLLSDSLALAGQFPEEKPKFFQTDMWQKEMAKLQDYIHLLLGRAWFNAGNHVEAEKALSLVAAKKRKWADVYHYLGMIAMAESNDEKAIDCFRRSLEIAERREETKTCLSRLLKRKYDYEGDPAGYFAKTRGGISFTDVTEIAGFGGQKAMGIAWGDYDQDGYPDVLLDGTRLFKNTGDGSFVNKTGESGLAAVKNANGGIWGDYNNDGYPDVFVTARAGNHLYKNMGNGLFSDVTESALGPVVREETQAAAWGDPDNDGFLDLYVANYERNGVTRGLGTQDRMYHNTGDGTFTDISIEAGIITEEAMCGRGVIWTDIDFNGFQDIVVANYRLDPNFLWMNDHFRFLECAGDFGVRGNMLEGAFGHSIAPVSGDLDNDGDLDLFITNLAHPRYIEFSDVNMMLLNDGAPDYHFTDAYADAGILFEETNADAAIADIDNDGDLDLFMTSIYPGRWSHLYINDETGKFEDISWYSGTRVEDTWATAFADYNNDGFSDLMVAGPQGVRLFKNNGGENHWIKVRIHDDRCNRFGIGSLVSVHYLGKKQIKEVAAGRGAGNQDALDLIFGLGDHDGPVEIRAKTLCGDVFRTVIDRPDQTVVLQ